MLENELKRIADALEVIALSLQPSNPAGMAQPDLSRKDPKPSRKAKEAKNGPVDLVPTEEIKQPASEDVVDEVAEDAPALSTDEMVAQVQQAVKLNRDATLAICKKYGYEKSLKEIPVNKYQALSVELATVK